MVEAFVIFPHQLFEKIPVVNADHFFVVEESLFFNQYPFHKQKIAFHRASMQYYFDHLLNEKTYINAHEKISDVRELVPHLKTLGYLTVSFFDPCDNLLKKRTTIAAKKAAIKIDIIKSPGFLNSVEELQEYKANSKKYFQTDFYINQRKNRNLLMDNDKPLGGKWSFDADNRKKYPKNQQPPKVKLPKSCEYHSEAVSYVKQYFPNNYGTVSNHKIWPINKKEATESLNNFLQHRFLEFGIYEDAIVSTEPFLNHSLLSPVINNGILTPEDVVEAIISYANKNKIPLNNTEGIIRQIIGWREFIRYMYLQEGSFQRNRNFWDFTNPMPKSFYDGTTGITPVDDAIKKLLDNAYNHHIERLMILSNFMLLCEINPDAVYQWFMEMYIDSYDWVMVPNVYGMGQFADGGLMCTKPYISGSNYILKMSNYSKDPAWTEIWDALFWRFMIKHRTYFSQNPRLNMLLSTFDKRDSAAKKALFTIAEDFINKLHSSEKND
jgi:deoxyribodipyrimidine photolyase-related protein